MTEPFVSPPGFDKIRAASPVDATKPHAWIQWKGTNVCADVHCGCGQLTHIDGDFTYVVQCSKCGALWGMDPYITLVPLTEPDTVGMCDPKITDNDGEDFQWKA